MTPQELKNSILQLAIQGKLVEQNSRDIPANLQKITQRETDVFGFDLPSSWKTAHLESVTRSIPSKQYQIFESQVCREGQYPVISQSKAFSIGFSDNSKKVFRHKDPVIIFGDHTAEIKLVRFNFIVGADGVKIFEPLYDLISAEFLFYVFLYHSNGLSKVGGYSRHYKFIKDKPIPIPPLSEQKRIVAKIEELLPCIDSYEQTWNRLEALNKRFPEDMKKSLLQYAIEGKLVEQRPEEGTAEELYRQIQEEKRRLVKEGKIKKERPLPEIAEDEVPFEIPGSWKWIRLGNILNIARGGSPRPIMDYLTDSPDGINWIKIGDTDKGGKYIYSTKEKIKLAGVAKSRFVHEGDFLLTNSMSFGRPYILRTSGCIHDGWLVLSNEYKGFYVDFLYYLLSSAFAYYQFCGSVSGAVVKNLNSDKVTISLFPLPPLSEQKRIVAKLEELLPLCDKLKNYRSHL